MHAILAWMPRVGFSPRMRLPWRHAVDAPLESIRVADTLAA
ncbi:hypothetical protein [Agromyces allii]|nr:hypothetical protein [Agromyces allii]